MKKIPRKNYVTYVTIVVATLAIVLLINSWHNASRREELQNSYIGRHISTVEYMALQSYMQENPDFIAYIGKTDCAECVRFEKELFRFIEEHNLIENFIFINLTEISDREDYLELFNREFDVDLRQIPNVAVVSEGRIAESADDSSRVTIDRVYQLLEAWMFIQR